jgi:hypothetical protein
MRPVPEPHWPIRNVRFPYFACCRVYAQRLGGLNDPMTERVFDDQFIIFQRLRRGAEPTDCQRRENSQFEDAHARAPVMRRAPVRTSAAVA